MLINIPIQGGQNLHLFFLTLTLIYSAYHILLPLDKPTSSQLGELDHSGYSIIWISCCFGPRTTKDLGDLNHVLYS